MARSRRASPLSKGDTENVACRPVRWFLEMGVLVADFRRDAVVKTVAQEVSHGALADLSLFSQNLSPASWYRTTL